MSASTPPPEKTPEQFQAEINALNEAVAARNRYKDSLAANAAALADHQKAILANTKAVEEFQAKWSALDAQAKSLLRECWERKQLFRHHFGIGSLALVWLGLLVCAIRWLEAPLSDMGKYGAIVLCVFLVVSISVPASVMFYIMKRSPDE